jgi:6-pyruvoyl tetrahydropterin synthase/QueD family protein
MYLVSREYSFCAAHRLEGHPKCGRLHGHNYRVEVVIERDRLTSEGMVLDFKDLDALVAPIFDTFDHRYLVSEENVAADDPYYANAREGDARLVPLTRSTAECMALYFAMLITDALHLTKLSFTYVHEIRVWETPKSCAIYRGAYAIS